MTQQLPLDLAGPAASGRRRLLLVHHGPAARAALFGAIADAQSGDRLAPVTVAVPSPLSGLALRRALGASAGLVNVHFTALARVAELLGAPGLAAAGRRPLAGPLRAEAVHAVLSADPGPLAPVAGHPSTTQHLAATFRELARVPATSLPAIAARGPRAAAVVRLFESYRARIADYYDENDLVLAAAAAIADGTASADETGHVIVHLPLGLSPGEHTLIEALATHDRCTVLLGLTGDAEVDRAQAEIHADRLAAALGPAVVLGPEPAVPIAKAIVSAPDPEDEVRAVVRRLLARSATGSSLAGAAILFRAPEPYARLLPEVLDAAGLPWNGSSPRRVADCAAGRVLLGLLALPDGDLARDEVAAWLASGPVRDPADDLRVNAARWDTLSRQAGVVQGTHQWAERLGAFHGGIDAKLQSARTEGDESEWQAQRLERDRADVAALQVFVADLAARLAPPDRPTWATLAAWARGLHDHYLGGEGHRTDWPEPELVGARRVEEALAELGGLDAFDDRADLARFRRALAAELDAPVGRVGRFGTGVLVGQLGQGYAADFEVVYVLGGAEGTLPPRGREDPLLPDRDRAGAPNLSLHADRRLEERRDYLAALASATERVLTFPRADPRAQRKRLPARWVVESARTLGDRDITAEQLRDADEQTWLEVVSSFAHLVTNGEPGSETEYALRSLSEARGAHRDLARHPLTAGMLARGFVAAADRASKHASPYDGFVGNRPDLAPGASRPTSPTALQDWAKCPFRYFLSRVLRLRAIPRPEATESLSSLDRGGLMHAILEEFVRDSPAPATPASPWTLDDAGRMAEIVDRHCNDAEARGITGRAVIWELERRHLFEDALHFLEVDQAVRTDHGVLPAPDGLERAFGVDGEPAVDVEVAGGRTVTFRGRIDRVDRSPDGRDVVVYDYKTGRSRPDLGDDPVGAGRYLQLPVYALAAKDRERAERATAFYWYIGDHGDTPFVGVDLDEAHERFVEVVGTIAAGIEGGCFTAVPGERTYNPRAQRETFESCAFCDFDRLCPVDRGTMAERKQDDPANLPFRNLRLPEPDEAPDGTLDEPGPERTPKRRGDA